MMFYLYLLALLTIIRSQENCEGISCSNVIDYVCGAIEYRDGRVVIMKYQNICIMRQESCQMKPNAEIYQASDILCNINKQHNEVGRRWSDFSIVGAYQACNHTCPTHCVDTYDPACAEIWQPGMEYKRMKPMINHCHVDLFSCSTGYNVTITTLGSCYENDQAFNFMKQVAAMKSLKLLDDGEVAKNTHKMTRTNRRRSNNDTLTERLVNALKKNA